MTVLPQRFYAIFAVALASIAAPACPVYAQNSGALPAPALSYSSTADLTLAAPVVAEVRVRKSDELKGKLAPGLASGVRRYLVQADVMTLIRGTGGVPPRIEYLVDLAPQNNGKWLKLEKRQFVVFARPTPARPNAIQLIGAAAHQPWTPELSSRVRDILREANTAGAPPRIAGVGQAFHVAGTIEGEGETQIFLKASDGRPLSLSVWRKPGVAPRWAVSLGEIVDEGAAPPARDTLLWYRLACSLPPRLSAASTAELDDEAARIAAEDYAIVIAQLGRCQPSQETRNLDQSF